MIIHIVQPQHASHGHMTGVLYAALETDEICSLEEPDKAADGYSSATTLWKFRTKRPVSEVLAALEHAGLNLARCPFIGLSPEILMDTVLAVLRKEGGA